MIKMRTMLKTQENCQVYVEVINVVEKKLVHELLYDITRCFQIVPFECVFIRQMKNEFSRPYFWTNK